MRTIRTPAATASARVMARARTGRSEGARLPGFFVLLLAALAGCRASGPRPLGPVDPAFVPAFEALGAAVEAGDDGTAERTLAAILARGPAGDTLARAEAFGRILEGRRLARVLELRLVARPDPADERRIVLELEARQGLEQSLRVRSLPGRLEVLWTGIDASGLEQRSARSVGVDAVGDFEVRPGELHRVGLGSFPIGTGTAMAVRANFELEFPGCELELEGQLYPVNRLPVESATVVRLAPYLPCDPVEPAELVRYLESGGTYTAAMLERAVRIPSERRAEALELLCASAARMTRPELERCLPALRWLSGNRHLGGDVDAWRRWLESRPASAWGQEPPTAR